MLLARVVLVIQLLALGGLGLAYFIRPHEMANLSGMLLMSPAAATDMRAFYGGLQIGLAAFIGLSLSRLDLTRAALDLAGAAVQLAGVGAHRRPVARWRRPADFQPLCVAA